MNKYEAIARVRKMKKPELEKLLLETLVFDDKSKINALCCNTNIMQYIEEIEKNLDLMELFLTDRNFNFQFQKMKEKFENILSKIDEIDKAQIKTNDVRVVE